MIQLADAQRAEEWIDEAVAPGARLLCGGKRKGTLLAPTVLTGTAETNGSIARRSSRRSSPWKPTTISMRRSPRVNGSPYGLQAGVFTRDIQRLFRAYEELEVGGVIAGDVPTFRIDHMPYGGVKDSGRGREGLRYAIEEMTEPKLLVLS